MRFWWASRRRSGERSKVPPPPSAAIRLSGHDDGNAGGTHSKLIDSSPSSSPSVWTHAVPGADSVARVQNRCPAAGRAARRLLRLRFDVLTKTKQPELCRYWTTRDRAANVRCSGWRRRRSCRQSRRACSTRTRGGSARIVSSGASAGRGGRRAGPGDGDERDRAGDAEIQQSEGERVMSGRCWRWKLAQEARGAVRPRRTPA